MPDQNPLEEGELCPFCTRDATQNVFLHEGRDFYIIADHAPLSDAHVLLIPRGHYPHLAAVPPELDGEFEALKRRIEDFITRNYGPVTYWENGIFGQSVPHAHLHAMSLRLDQASYVDAGPPFDDLETLRRHHAAVGGPYFTVQHEGPGHFLPPDREVYLRVIQRARELNNSWGHMSRDERRAARGHIVQALKERWFSAMPDERSPGRR
jgi:diadenosine tetraphosphate (Ap4A) HIT family hydrolase